MIPAAGLSPNELETALKAEFAKQEIYQNAEFQVLSGNICGWTVTMVTVGGEVKKPGPVSFTDGITLWQAIQAAGGTSDFADSKQVKLFRGGKIQVYNLDDLKSREVKLILGDVIEVLRVPK